MNLRIKLLSTLILLAAQSLAPSTQAAGSAWPDEWLADGAFYKVWSRADEPVAGGTAARSWLWGPAPFAVANEPYAESFTGRRLVEYLDKARMEVNDPSLDRASPWFVTSGLLVSEMVNGQIQTGNTRFESRPPAEIPVAGDPTSADAPTYSTFTQLVRRTPDMRGKIADAKISRRGVTSEASGQAVSPNTARFGITHYDQVTGHNVPAVFHEWMLQSGAVLEGGRYTQAQVMDPIYTLGRPITEAYWADVLVKGQKAGVMVQLYERRALTYNPNNPPEWRVEMANVGRAYFDWRYQGKGPEPAISAQVEQTGVRVRAWNWPPNTQVEVQIELKAPPSPLGLKVPTTSGVDRGLPVQELGGVHQPLLTSKAPSSLPELGAMGPASGVDRGLPVRGLGGVPQDGDWGLGIGGWQGLPPVRGLGGVPHLPATTSGVDRGLPVRGLGGVPQSSLKAPSSLPELGAMGPASGVDRALPVRGLGGVPQSSLKAPSSLPELEAMGPASGVDRALPVRGLGGVPQSSLKAPSSLAGKRGLGVMGSTPLSGPQSLAVDAEGRFSTLLPMTPELRDALQSGADVQARATSGQANAALPVSGRASVGKVRLEGAITQAGGPPGSKSSMTLLARDGTHWTLTTIPTTVLRYSEGDPALPGIIIAAGTAVSVEGVAQGDRVEVSEMRLLSVSRTGAQLGYTLQPGGKSIRVSGTGWPPEREVTLTLEKYRVPTEYRGLSTEYRVTPIPHSLLSPQPSALSPQSSVLNPQSSVLNPQSSVLSDSRGNLSADVPVPAAGELPDSPLWLFAVAAANGILLAQVAIPFDPPAQAQGDGSAPPQLFALAQAGEQRGQTGSYCWRTTCSDTPGVPLPPLSLEVGPGELLGLRSQFGPNPNGGLNPNTLSANIYSYDNPPGQTRQLGDTLLFTPKAPPVYSTGDKPIPARPFSLALPRSLPPGKYALLIQVAWDDPTGNPNWVIYGFAINNSRTYAVGQRGTMGDGRWTTDDGRWTMDDGRWTMDDGRWTMDDGRWTMDDGRWTTS